MSAFIRLANLFQLYAYNPVDGTRENHGHYTNGCLPGGTLQFRDRDWTYLSFVYQGAAKNRTGDNLQASLMMSTNQIAQTVGREAVEHHYHLEIFTVTLTANSTAVEDRNVLTHENWLVSTMTYDPEKLEVVLSSGIDAVGANAPSKLLTRDRVGALPVTASISSR